MVEIPTFAYRDIFLFLGFFYGSASLFIAYIYWQRQRLPYYPEKYLLTQKERYFYKALELAVGDTFKILFKVRLADIVHCSEKMWDRGFGHRIATQHIDFVLVDPDTAKIRLCIELDDPSHDHPRQQKRDRWKSLVLDKATVLLIRIKTEQNYTPNIIRKRIWVNLRNHDESHRKNVNNFLET